MNVLMALYDKKATVFLAPVVYPSAADAERAFVGLLAAGDSTPSQWPDDFDLYHLADIDLRSGECIPNSRPSLVITGQSASLVLSRLRREKNSCQAGKDNSKEAVGAAATKPHAAAAGGENHPDLFHPLQSATTDVSKGE